MKLLIPLFMFIGLIAIILYAHHQRKQHARALVASIRARGLKHRMRRS